MHRWFPVALIVCLLSLTTQAQTAQRVWFDGSVDDGSVELGKLLSDNEDYWGEVIITGVTYEYETPPDAPADNGPDRVGRIGRLLLNGNQGRDRFGQVGLKGDQPLVVVLDFNRVHQFNEWQIITPSKQVDIKLELRSQPDEAWRTVYERSRADCPDEIFHRLRLEGRPEGRYARLTVQAEKTTLLREVLAWGDVAGDEDAKPEPIAPIAQGQYPVGIAYPTITGVASSVVSDREAFYWVQSLSEAHRQQPAVWAKVDAWESISHQAVLPAAAEVNQPIHLRLTRNETEAVALVLRNTLVNGKRELRVSLTPPTDASGKPASRLQAKLGIFGVIGDRAFGNQLGPIFEADNLLGSSLMSKYLLNGQEIRHYPDITLPQSGNAVFWLSVTTDHASPGVYHAAVSVTDGQSVPVVIEVVDVTLPSPFAHIKTYSTNRTRQFPFEYADRAERDIRYGLASGINDWGRIDAPNKPLVTQLAKEQGMELLWGMRHLVPSKYVHNVYQSRWASAADFPPNAAQEIRDHVRQVVAEAEALGLTYDQWYGGTGDEPGVKNMAAVAELCRLIKQADPRVNIYINPCFWTGFDRHGVSLDEVVSPLLEGWYARDVDVSVPLFLLLEGRPGAMKALSAKRKVNSYYYVSGHLDRSESALEVQKYRRMAWDSLTLGYNGWAFYSWYSPRGNAWNHFDRNPRGHGLQEPNDYQMIYPGPRGVVPTRQSEALREGWEDWRLIHFLRSQGKDKQVEALLDQYRQGTAPHLLRQQALDLALTR